MSNKLNSLQQLDELDDELDDNFDRKSNCSDNDEILNTNRILPTTHVPVPINQENLNTQKFLDDLYKDYVAFISSEYSKYNNLNSSRRTCWVACAKKRKLEEIINICRQKKINPPKWALDDLDQIQSSNDWLS